MTLMAMAGHIFGRRYTLNMARFWGVGTHFLLKYIVGVTYEIRGRHHYKSGAIFACKHQSVLETTMIQNLAYDSCIVLKQELLWIPFFGQALSALGVIGIRRRKGGGVLQLKQKAQACLEEGRNFMIYPEGTRTTPDQATKLKYGVAALYETANKPVIPIVLNTGYFWPRRTFLRYPGHVVYEYLEPIQPGLSPKDFLTRLTHTMEEGCRQLKTQLPPDLIQSKKPKILGRKGFMIPLILVIGLAYAGFITEKKLHETLTRWEQDIQEKGFRFNYSHKSSGFKKLGYHITFHEPRLYHKNLPHMVLRGQEILLYKNIFSKDRVAFDATDVGGFYDTTALGQVGSIKGKLSQKLVLECNDVKIQDFTIKTCTYETPLTHFFHDHKFSAKFITLPLIEDVLDHLTLWFELDAFHVTGSILDFGAVLTQWLHQGGVIDIKSFHITKGLFQADLKGSLSLDEDKRPLGALTLRAKGIDQGLHMLHKNRLVPAWSSSLLTLLLQSFKENDDHVIPITLQEGYISIAGLPVMALPSF